MSGAFPAQREQALAELHTRGAARWTSFEIDLATFARHVDAVAGDDPDLSGLNAEDLYLACACAVGSRAAIDELDREYKNEVDRACRTTSSLPVEPADVAQMLREKLLLAPSAEARPKIAEYAGRGPLRMWLRIALMRMVQNLAMRAPRDRPGLEEPAFELPSSLADPELDVIRQQYQAEFRDAFHAAWNALPANDRTLLRQRTKGLTQEELASAYDVHVNTIARWLAKARQTLETNVRADLSQRLRLEAGDFTAMLRLVQSQLDISLGTSSNER